jgi:hypothetical protein
MKNIGMKDENVIFVNEFRTFPVGVFKLFSEVNPCELEVLCFSVSAFLKPVSCGVDSLCTFRSLLYLPVPEIE